MSIGLVFENLLKLKQAKGVRIMRAKRTLILSATALAVAGILAMSPANAGKSIFDGKTNQGLLAGVISEAPGIAGIESVVTTEETLALIALIIKDNDLGMGALGAIGTNTVVGFEKSYGLIYKGDVAVSGVPASIIVALAETEDPVDMDLTKETIRAGINSHSPATTKVVLKMDRADNGLKTKIREVADLATGGEAAETLLAQKAHTFAAVARYHRTAGAFKTYIAESAHLLGGRISIASTSGDCGSAHINFG